MLPHCSVRRVELLIESTRLVFALTRAGSLIGYDPDAG
jgi:hypothetical protein